jgi:uncharacterized membrane-anchored protein YitT (DUF2179 family)
MLKKQNFKANSLERNTKDILFIGLGVASAGFGLKSFLLPNHFLDGGITGISLLLNAVGGFNVSILLVLLNIPFVIIGYFHISKAFAWKTLIAIVGLSLLLTFLEFPLKTSDRLLTAFFGGFFLGMGIGLSIRGGVYSMEQKCLLSIRADERQFQWVMLY